MNLAEYSTALKALPMTYKILPFDDVSVVQYKGTLFLCHKDKGPIYYKNTGWYEFITREVND